MKSLYVPLYRTAVGYTVSFGRRWSLLEHLLLVELANRRCSAPTLAKAANVPLRLVIEAIINLLRVNWIEVRVVGDEAVFAATPAGRYRAESESLPVSLKRDTKWASLCVERLTGAWFSADDLELVYERDLPDDAEKLKPRLYTYDRNDPGIRELLTLFPEESLEPIAFNFRTPSRPYARVEIEDGGIKRGLPDSAPLVLRDLLVSHSSDVAEAVSVTRANSAGLPKAEIRTTIEPSDIVVGGSDHLALVKECLAQASSHVIIHSCFVSPKTVELLLPEFESAAKRKVRVDLLWGLRTDPEDPKTARPIAESEKALDSLGPLRPRVQLSPISSGSHAKVIVFDQRDVWTSVVGSCNWLSSAYDALEVSFRSRSQILSKRLVGQLLFGQLPASGAWTAVARRLDRAWDKVWKSASKDPNDGLDQIAIILDKDHYACVTAARDAASRSIALGCDLFGIAAETSVLVPMERAAQLEKNVQLFYSRPSVRLSEEGHAPDLQSMRDRGLHVTQIDELHGKFLAWDDDFAIITSFNWLATVSGTRVKGAELGILVQSRGVRRILSEKLFVESAGLIDPRDGGTSELGEAPEGHRSK